MLLGTVKPKSFSLAVTLIVSLKPLKTLDKRTFAGVREKLRNKEVISAFTSHLPDGIFALFWLFIDVAELGTEAT